jgi:hypothetical protein
MMKNGQPSILATGSEVQIMIKKNEQPASLATASVVRIMKKKLTTCQSGNRVRGSNHDKKITIC